MDLGFRGLGFMPLAQKTYRFKEVYIETTIRSPKKGRSFRLQVGLREGVFESGLGFV